jgi:hypothetical protein
VKSGVIRAGVLATAVAAVALAAACSTNEPSYYPAPTAVEIGGGGMAMAEPYAAVDLPFRPPSDDERMQLGEDSQRLGFAVPWLRSDQVAVSVLYTVTNLGEQTAEAKLELDGASEFANYDVVALRAAADAAVVNNDDQVEILPLVTIPLLIEGGGKVSGVLREDDFDEAALDLDALARFGAVPAAVLINNSQKSQAGLDMLPAGHIRPALYRVRLALSGGGHLRLEFVVRVRDQGGQLQNGGDPFAPAPPAYMPPMMMPPP